MSSLLVFVGVAVAIYWIVKNVMGPGIDEAVQKRPPARPSRKGKGAPAQATSRDPMSDWQIVLDLPSGASRREILEAVRHRLRVAEAAGDTAARAKIALAAAAALRR